MEKEKSVEILEQLSTSEVTFAKLHQKSHDIQANCKDYNVENAGRKVLFDPQTMKFIYEPKEDKVRRVDMSRFAMSQFCNKVGVPIRYTEKCIESGRLELASENLNSWTEDYQGNLFIREYQDKVRGVLTDKYSVLDTPDILDVVDSALDLKKLKIKGHLVSPEKLHLRFVDTEKLAVPDEDLFWGIQIDSSDVGRSILTINYLLYKQVCTNGLCVPKLGGNLFQQKHVGITKDEFYKGLSSSLQLIPTITERTKLAIAHGMTDTNMYVKATKNQKDFDVLVNYLKAKTRLSDDGVAKVIDLMQNTYTPSRWGLVNSITQVAQDYTLDRRVELEFIAGELLTA